MGETTDIPWCDATWNPWSGCTKVSPACAHCYAASLPPGMRRHAEWGDDKPRAMASEIYWKQPLAWDRKAEREGKRTRVFCGSTCDVMEGRDDVSASRARLVQLIHDTPNLDWLLLTKRAENWPIFDRLLTGGMREKWPHNLWAGATVENQEWADKRIRFLLQVPAPVIFLSMEPLLGPVVLPSEFLALGKRAWVIAGGESGPHARPSHPDWFRSLRDQCQRAGVPFFFKQWGEWVGGCYSCDNESEVIATLQNGTRVDVEQDYPDERDAVRFYEDRFHAHSRSATWCDPLTCYSGACSVRVGRAASGHLLDGVEYREFPQ